jgi:hypothetical protein
VKAIALSIFLLSCNYCFAQAVDSSGVRPAIVPNLPKDAVKIFPNPMVNDLYITVRMEGLVIKAAYLYDKDGNRAIEQKVSSILGGPIKIYVGKLQPGNYYLVLETNKQPFRAQLIKQ